MQVPEENERQDILHTLTDTITLAPDVSLEEVSLQTAALVASDIVDLVSRGKHNYMKRALQDRYLTLPLSSYYYI